MAWEFVKYFAKTGRSSASASGGKPANRRGNIKVQPINLIDDVTNAGRSEFLDRAFRAPRSKYGRVIADFLSVRLASIWSSVASGSILRCPAGEWLQPISESTFVLIIPKGCPTTMGRAFFVPVAGLSDRMDSGWKQRERTRKGDAAQRSHQNSHRSIFDDDRVFPNEPAPAVGAGRNRA